MASDLLWESINSVLRPTVGIHQFWLPTYCGNPFFTNSASDLLWESINSVLRPTVGIHQFCPPSYCGNPLEYIQQLSAFRFIGPDRTEVVENEAGREKDKDVAAGEKEVDEERPANFGEVVENEAGGEKDKDVAAGEKEVVEKEAGPSEEGKKRGKKRKAPGGSSLPECKYEQIRKRNIKEKEDFLASLDSE